MRIWQIDSDMNIPRHPILKWGFYVYVVAWISLNLTFPTIQSWSIGFKLFSVFGVILVIQIADFELSLKHLTGEAYGSKRSTQAMGKPFTYLFLAFMYGLPVALGISNLLNGRVDGGIVILTIVHYFVFYFAWVAFRLRK